MSDAAAVTAAPEKAARRKIPGGLPYTTSHGVLKRVMDKIPTSEKPSVFNTDFLATVMGATGGAARPIPPILKTVGFLSQSGAPTELYSQFQTDAGRAGAAVQALKNGFAEIFRRNQYAHRADRPALTDIVVAVTGLPKTDSVVGYMVNTFQVFQQYGKDFREDQAQPDKDKELEQPVRDGVPGTPVETLQKSLALAYNINIILPESTNVEVYNAIFRSLKGNLLT
ncbi:hypothetical protein FB548_2184 [Pseudoxanthomonas sp. 3HH-4]|uniref:DUF5343 domain-containing protein n=1 Tax=Pseudoxanthomonas sp. 3HH-4 TaxID=1690214 RepID=UPI0011524062|nr:DUF5343 domain-containing protein [Pseudoxanthomonas sp. 3HH-4]TQM12253.1 hypothetical protein FB548_2184 [Pseudoxanthomonas sp. 3HH-4]